MTSWRTTVSRAELRHVTPILGSVAPYETDHEGVWVHTRNGKRYWTSRTPHIVWEIEGDATDENLVPYCLPGRLIWHGLDLANEADEEEVVFSTPENIVGMAMTAQGSITIDLPVTDGELPTLPSYVPFASTATLPSRKLFAIINGAMHRPIGLADNEPSAPVLLVVGDGEIATSVDWTSSGGLRSTFRYTVPTTGESRSEISAPNLRSVIREIDPDEEVTLGIPENMNIPVIVEGDGWRAAVDQSETGAARLHDELGEALADATGETCRTLAPGVLMARMGHRQIRAELLDRPIELVRLTTVILADVDPTPELLDQLNATNASLVGARIWLNGNVVVAGAEVPVERLAEIGIELKLLVRQIEGYDVYLSALGDVA
jgi:hypothetical protein